MNHSTKILATLLLLFPALLQAQWSYLNGPFSNEMYMEVVNADTLVFSDGATGKIYHSFDGGATWTAFDTQLEYSWISDFDFPTDQIGYGCGGTYFGLYTDVLIKTTDGGATWDTLSTTGFGGYTFDHIAFLNPDTGFVVNSGRLYRTTDGGLNFTEQADNTDGFMQLVTLSLSPDGVVFISGRKLVAEATYETSIFRSSNLGLSWNKVYSDTIPNADNFYNRFINEVHFPTSEIGYAVGGNGLFLKTTDGGLSWSQTYVSPFTGLTALHFVSAHEGYINNAGGIYKTSDGGTTWQVQNMTPPQIVQSIQFATENVGYALTDQKIYKTTNGGTTGVHQKHRESRMSIYPNPAQTEIRLADTDHAGIRNMCLLDLAGKVVKVFPYTDNVLDVSDLNSGVYVLRIQTDRGSDFLKVIVE